MAYRKNSNDNMSPFIDNKNIHLSFDKCYSYHVENNKVIWNIKDCLSYKQHEEAEIRIIYHICQINFGARIVVRCSNSDILMILLSNIDHLNATLNLWKQWGVENHERSIKVDELYQILGGSISKALPCFHALTGCNYVPASFQKGKLRSFKLLEKFVEFQLACQEITR